jgi:hypothetical protein
VIKLIYKTFCVSLVGAGDEFLRWKYKSELNAHYKSRLTASLSSMGNGIMRKKMKNTDPPQLVSAIEDQNGRLNAVASFLLKKNFKFVRYVYYHVILSLLFLRLLIYPLRLFLWYCVVLFCHLIF